AAVAGAQAIDLPGVRDLVATYYPTAPQPSWDRVYRPASLLGHYSAVGAFGLLNLMLALVLAATRQAGFPGWWLALVMAANMLSLIASETYAPLAALPVGVVAALLVVRRIPSSHLTAGLPVVGAGAVVLWPSISGRVGSQFSGAGGIALPETLQTRIDYWQGFFIPALLEHGPWLGTGTLIPPEVPRPLVNFVDNGYLWQLFRAGLPGLAALIIMLASVAALAWAMRASDDPLRRVVGAGCLGAVGGWGGGGDAGPLVRISGVRGRHPGVLGVRGLSGGPPPGVGVRRRHAHPHAWSGGGPGGPRRSSLGRHTCSLPSALARGLG